MKTTTFLIFSLCFLTAFGQINLENTYSDGFVTRVKLENSGEKYYIVNAATNQVNLYHADHSFWKSITLSVDIGAFDLTVYHLSETKINADSNIEIAYSYYTEISSVITYTSKIINENNVVLLTVNDASSIEVSEIVGIPVKIICLIDDANSSSKVYSVPALSLENTYTDGYITRVKLENSGEKYYQLDETNNLVKLYNSNHTFWNEINILLPVNSTILGISHLSETKLNVDSQLEIAYSYYSIVNFLPVYESKIINELGTTLLTIADATNINVSEIAGLPNKIIAGFMDMNTFLFSSKVYSIPSFTLENSYADGMVTRVKLENSGEKYYLFDELTNQVKLYNSDHTPLPPMMLSAPIGATILWITHLSETKINADSQIEVAYSYTTVNGSVTSYTSVIINYNGSIYLNISGAFFIFVSEIGGLQNKLIVPMDGVSETSRVYSLPTTTLSANKEIPVAIDIAVYPNPTREKLNVVIKDAAIKHLLIATVNGSIVKEIKQTAENITIDVSDLSAGVYFITGQTTDGVAFRKKVIIY